MTPEEVAFVRAVFAGFGVGGLVAAAIGFLVVRHYLPGYLAEKGKNLATKEDIAEITDQVEKVKDLYAALQESRKVENQLRVAAIDRRLQAHQEGFTHLRDLIAHAYSDEVGQKVLECQHWWERNCLYLEPRAREAFSNAYSAASVHRGLLQAGQHMLTAERNQEHVAQVQRNWQRLIGALNVMLEVVALPPMTNAEAAAMTSASGGQDNGG